MAKRKKSGSRTKPSVKVQDLKPKHNPKGGVIGRTVAAIIKAFSPVKHVS